MPQGKSRTINPGNKIKLKMIANISQSVRVKVLSVWFPLIVGILASSRQQTVENELFKLSDWRNFYPFDCFLAFRGFK